MGRQIRRKEREMLPKRKDTIAYVIDENSPNTPSDALIVTSYGGGDVEEAWLREHFSGLWDDEEGREFAGALLRGMGDIYKGEWTTDYDVLTSAFEVHVAEVTYEDDELDGVYGGVEAMMRECSKMNLSVGDASVGEILSVLEDMIGDDVMERLVAND